MELTFVVEFKLLLPTLVEIEFSHLSSLPQLLMYELVESFLSTVVFFRIEAISVK
jgi:hypothetical protein